MFKNKFELVFKTLHPFVNTINLSGGLAEVKALFRLWETYYYGNSIDDYINEGSEDELARLDDLIDAARELV